MTQSAVDWSMLAPARRIVFERFAASGAPPSAGEAAQALGVEPEALLSTWRELHERHQLVLGPRGDAIRMAHPFSASPMGFVVRAGDDRLWWGGCAWDSFGILAALDEELEILTRCPHCGSALTMLVGPTRPPSFGVVRIPCPAREWWIDVIAVCSQVRLFCNQQHARAFASRHATSGGALVDAERMWRLALGWYGDRLDPNYRPHDARLRQQQLDDVGLSGPFWELG
jgi:hypothetical protein